MRLIIISTLPLELAGPIAGLQKKIGARADAREALRYPPHITLRTGLVCPDDQAEGVARDFLEHARTRYPIAVRADSVVASAYTDSTGIERGFLAYRIARTAELRALHLHLLAYTAWQKGPQGPFEPHLSLCYKDVAPPMVSHLAEEFDQELRTTIPAWRLERVELWREEAAGWVPFAATRLEGGPAEPGTGD